MFCSFYFGINVIFSLQSGRLSPQSNHVLRYPNFMTIDISTPTKDSSSSMPFVVVQSSKKIQNFWIFLFVGGIKNKLHKTDFQKKTLQFLLYIVTKPLVIQTTKSPPDFILCEHLRYSFQLK